LDIPFWVIERVWIIMGAFTMKKLCSGNFSSPFSPLTKLSYLLGLADSSLPVGGLAHSNGLEQFCFDPGLKVEQLGEYLESWIEETLSVEISFCAGAQRLIPPYTSFFDSWEFINEKFGAYRIGRESRRASEKMGYRLLELGRLIFSLIPFEPAIPLPSISQSKAKDTEKPPSIFYPEKGHYPLVFGYLGFLLGIEESALLTAFGTQALQAQISSAQRLMSLGQMQAMELHWGLKSTLVQVIHQIISSEDVLSPHSFTPMLDLASMNHPYLNMRLFLS
jgi:urease accessory protein UreF